MAVLMRGLSAALALHVSALFGEAAAVAVLYPDVREPYRAVFQSLVEGMQLELGPRLRSYQISDEADLSDLRRWLEQERPGAIIALGSGGLDAATRLRTHIPVVVGALLLTQETEEPVSAGISLAADPQQLFARLKALVPGIQRVFVVYNPEHNAWLVDLAKQAAERQHIELVAYRASDLRSAVIRYRAIVDEARSLTDAIWLPLDSTTVDERVVLPLLLEAAWDKRLVIFSSNPAHAQRGALFSVYPDNVALGRRLADMAMTVERGGQRLPTVVPLRELKMAVNLRTADHLGLQFTPSQQKEFGLVFPAP
jgi:putative ABC transport system substrate-binding protein